MSRSMGGQRNTRFLKVLAGVSALLVALYILYGYRETSGDLQQKSRHLKEVQSEYKALNKRFDMLSNELKGTHGTWWVGVGVGVSASALSMRLVEVSIRLVEVTS